MRITRQRGSAVRRLWRLCWVAAVVLPAAAHADGAPTGPVASRYAIADMTVPLPEGAWQVVADAEQRLPGDFPADRLHAAALVQLSGNAVAALVLVQAATGGSRAWGVPSNCRRSDLYEARVLTSASSLLAVCDYVAPVIQDVGPDSSVAWSAAERMARDHGWSLPSTWLVVGTRVADDGDLLDVRYYFNPDVLALPPRDAGAPPAGAGEGWYARLCAMTSRGYRWALGSAAADPRWAASGWSPAAVAADPRRRAVTADLIAWSGLAVRAVRAGFANRPLPLLVMPAPWAETPAPPPQPSIGARGDAWPGLAVWKTVSWRIVGSSLDLLVSFSVTGSFGAAGAITFIGAAVNSVGYYLHEIAWNDYLGQGTVADLPSGGIDR